MSEALKALSLPRILLVEDDEEIRRSVAEVLEDSGYEIEEAENGLQAYEKLHAAKELPALILLDLMMPVMDGMGIASRYRYSWVYCRCIVRMGCMNFRYGRMHCSITRIGQLHCDCHLVFHFTFEGLWLHV